MNNNFDINNELRTPNLDTLAQTVLNKIDSGVDFISEKMPQIENFCKIHQQALSLFCKSPKGFQPVLEIHNLLPKNTETPKNNAS